MPDRAYHNAIRRLQRILADEHYGPKLAKIHGEQERQILRLIEEGRGKEARQSIEAADLQRRATDLEKHYDYLRRRAAENMLRQYGKRASPQTIAQGVRSMSPSELKWTIHAGVEDMARRAQAEPDHEVMVSGEMRVINPFWYH